MKVPEAKGHACALILATDYSRLNSGRHASFNLAGRFNVELTDVRDQEDLHLEYCQAVAKAASRAHEERHHVAPCTRQEVGAGNVLLLDPTLRSECIAVTPNGWEPVDRDGRNVDDLACLDRNLVNHLAICADNGFGERQYIITLSDLLVAGRRREEPEATCAI